MSGPIMLLKSKNSRMLAPPPDITKDNGFGSSDSDDESIGPPVSLGSGMKNMLVRQDTFYDVNYQEVKVSTVPQTKEGWEFFMDLLKTEHRKFKLLLTNLRIERMKILKEMELFSNSFSEVKLLIKAQFETSMVDLRNVNVARLLNGEINKRSSSYIKTKVSPPKAAHKTLRPPSKSPPGGGLGLTTVRETFGAIDEESDGDSGDPSSVKLSTEAERLNRPKVPLEYDVDDKVERRNKLRKKSMIQTFHVGTQTVEPSAVQVTRSSLAANRLEKMRKDAMLVETLQSQSHVHPHTLAQPFLGYVRKHEKIYAREIGLMRIALREFKGIYDHAKAHLDNVMMMTCSANISPNLQHSLHQLQMLLADGGWVFDSRFFIRKVQMNPLEDPLDVAAQANIIASYQEDAQDNESQISEATSAGDSQKAAALIEVREELKVLMGDLNARAREKGGWRALLYTSNGTLDMNMPLQPWTPEEQVLILQEKLRHVQSKSAEKEKQHAEIVKKLQETMDQAHHRDHHRHSHRSVKPHMPHGVAAGHAPQLKSPAPAGRSMSVSGSSSSASPLVQMAALNNQLDGHGTAKQAPAAHRHTLAHVGKTALPLGIAAHKDRPTSASIPAGPHSDDLVRTIEAVPIISDELLPHEASEGAAEKDAGVAKAQASLPGEFSASMKQVIETLSTLYATLSAANQQQEQQQHLIVELQTQIRHQQEMLRHAGHHRGGPEHPHDDQVLFGSIDGESSVLSHASQEIIDEYQQLGPVELTPKVGTHQQQHHAAKNGGAPGTIQTSASHGHLTAHEVAAGTVGFGSAGAEHKRRGSVLVQHRDGGQIEYVPIGKVGATQSLRITVNNELRGHKHLLARPASASAASVGSPQKTFASIMAAGAGSKAPIDKYRQFEMDQRREKAMKLHQGEAPRPPSLDINASPLMSASSKADVLLRVPSMEPPSPKKVRKLSSNTLAHELSTIIDSIEGGSVGSSVQVQQDPLSPAKLPAGRNEGNPTENNQGRRDTENIKNINTLLGGIPTTFDGSPEDLIKTLNTLCNKLQDSLVVHAASLKTGQEIMAGDVEGHLPGQHGVHHGNDLLRSEYLPHDLHIGELAIDREKAAEMKPARPKTHDTRYLLNSNVAAQNSSAQRRPKTAGDVAGSTDSYEDIFHGMLAPPTATQMHSDVSLYATTLQNRYTHHVQEAKKIEAAIMKLGKSTEQEELEHQQKVAQTLYASSSIFRPQSAAPTTAPFGTSSSIPGTQGTEQATPGKSQRTGHANRSQSASAATANQSYAPVPRKSRGVTAAPFAVPFAKVNADLEGTSVYSPRLNEMSTELSNLSELDVPVMNFRS